MAPFISPPSSPSNGQLAYIHSPNFQVCGAQAQLSPIFCRQLWWKYSSMHGADSPNGTDACNPTSTTFSRCADGHKLYRFMVFLKNITMQSSTPVSKPLSALAITIVASKFNRI
ncbi:hypothetical protein M413DRAFT_33138 [Hebeloma cylindrosporum]|uniref:Uncharacterized protein n=1 Tax=Hebeloma cylindrosporum TaxID=76867 RepID=A0A0C2X9G0_HEBCY|nr:hypothetical protein M413DRAFT_33138 [Hebeloma cylindrosporum h7]